MSNLTSPKLSPDTRKKKSALPSLLSNLRNAQAAAFGGSASDHEREVRPLVANSPQLQQRNVPSNSLASTIQSFSQRFGSDWHKRGKRKKGKGVTLNIPTGFYYAVGCFFILFPLFFLVYILARHSVFGDEGDTTSTTKHIHEVPATLVTGGVSFEAGKESVVVDINNVDGVVNSEVENEIQGVGMNDNAVKEIDVSTLRNPSINLPPPSDTAETETKNVDGVQEGEKTQVGTADQSGAITPDKNEVTILDTPDKVVKADESNESVAADDTTKLQGSNGEVGDMNANDDSKAAASELKEDKDKDKVPQDLPVSDESNVIESKSSVEVLEDPAKEKIVPEELKVASIESDIVSTSEKKEEAEKEAPQDQTEDGKDAVQRLLELEKKLEQQSIEIENLKAEPMDVKEVMKEDEAKTHGNLRRLQL